MPFFEVDTGRIYYEAHGRGDPPLVLVHGLACALEDWRNQVKHFASSRRVVCLDQRGHGKSVGHAAGFDIETYGADVAALIAALRLPPAVLVGHSMGCRVVLECARTSPDVVAGLVLIDGSRIAAGKAEQAYRATRDAIAESGFEAFAERLFAQMFTPTSDPAVRDATVARALRLPAPASLELMPRMAAWDAESAEEALKSVKVPVTVVQSTHLNENRERVSLRPGDTVPWLELVRDRVPHAQVEIVAGIGHFTMLEAAEVVNAHIEALVKKLGDRLR